MLFRSAGAGSAESPGTRGIFDAEGVALTFCAAFEAIDRRRVVGFGAGGDSVDEGATVNFDVLSNDTDADAPGDTFTVTEVNGLAGQVGNAVALEVGGIVVGDLTVNADGSASFVTTSDLTVEIFSVSANYTMNDGGASPQTGTIDITINPQDDNAPFLSAAGLALEGTTLLQYDEDSIWSPGRRRAPRTSRRTSTTSTSMPMPRWMTTVLMTTIRLYSPSSGTRMRSWSTAPCPGATWTSSVPSTNTVQPR